LQINFLDIIKKVIHLTFYELNSAHYFFSQGIIQLQIQRELFIAKIIKSDLQEVCAVKQVKYDPITEC
jgi:hypothetical protein